MHPKSVLHTVCHGDLASDWPTLLLQESWDLTCFVSPMLACVQKRKRKPCLATPRHVHLTWYLQDRRSEIKCRCFPCSSRCSRISICTSEQVGSCALAGNRTGLSCLDKCGGGDGAGVRCGGACSDIGAFTLLFFLRHVHRQCNPMSTRRRAPPREDARVAWGVCQACLLALVGTT